MKQLIFAGFFAVLGTGILVVADKHRNSIMQLEMRPSVNKLTFKAPQVHAAGRIEGMSETVLIRPQFPGRVESVAVTRGTQVKSGQLLFQLDPRRYEAQRDLALARLNSARAKRMRLIAGARDSEIEAANQNAVAAGARYESSRSRFERATKLFERNALSSQGLEDYRADHDAHFAMLSVARQRVETIRANPRIADLMAADAEIASAEAQLKMANIDLQRCSIVAPCSAVVLAIDIHPGEWFSPEMPEPAMHLANTERLRVVADIDERDALRVATGQICEITADAIVDQAYVGTVVEIEPRMEPKRIYGGWAGERNETHTRRVWIDVNTDVKLPVGLPVEVKISI